MVVNDRDLVVMVGFSLLFLLINFNRDLGNIYLGMLLLSYMVFTTDKIKTFNFQNGLTGGFQSLLKAFIFYAAFVLFSGFFLSLFHSGDVIQGQIIMSVLKTFSQTTPVLAGSVVISILAWGIIVPIVETNAFFGSLFEYITDRTNTSMQGMSAKLAIIIVTISFIFAVFHATAKGVTNNGALSLTFIFAAVSLWLIYQEKQTKTAVYFHIIANVLATMAGFGLISG